MRLILSLVLVLCLTAVCEASRGVLRYSGGDCNNGQCQPPSPVVKPEQKTAGAVVKVEASAVIQPANQSAAQAVQQGEGQRAEPIRRVCQRVKEAVSRLRLRR